MLKIAFAEETVSSPKKSVESVVDVSIIGSTELPRVEFDLPWRLPSIQKREDQKPNTEIPWLLEPLDPERHRKLVYFKRYLELDLPEFKAR